MNLSVSILKSPKCEHHHFKVPWTSERINDVQKLLLLSHISLYCKCKVTVISGHDVLDRHKASKVWRVSSLLRVTLYLTGGTVDWGGWGLSLSISLQSHVSRVISLQMYNVSYLVIVGRKSWGLHFTKLLCILRCWICKILLVCFFV